MELWQILAKKIALIIVKLFLALNLFLSLTEDSATCNDKPMCYLLLFALFLLLVFLVVTFLLLGFVFIFVLTFVPLRAAELIILDFDFLRFCFMMLRVPLGVIVPL
jgi:hypothetical protein